MVLVDFFFRFIQTVCRGLNHVYRLVDGYFAVFFCFLSFLDDWDHDSGYYGYQ